MSCDHFTVCSGGCFKLNPPLPGICTGGQKNGFPCDDATDCEVACLCNVPTTITTPTQLPTSLSLPTSTSLPTLSTIPMLCEILEETHNGNCNCNAAVDFSLMKFCDICFLSTIGTWRKLDCNTLILEDFGSDNSCSDLEFEVTDDIYPICTGGSFSCLFSFNTNSNSIKHLNVTPTSEPGDSDKISINYRLFCNGEEIIGGKDKPTDSVNLIKINILKLIFYYIF